MGAPTVTFTNAEEKGIRLSYSLSEGGGEQVGLGVRVVLLFLECSLCPI